ncbi:MAG TPA: amino acid permease, partial [Terriglobales bacterium]|nr:amino acid permease [Terriglobales bacterium]
RLPTAANLKPASEAEPTLVRGLSLMDSVLLLVGGIIGSAVFLAVKDAAAPLHHPLLLLAAWVAGGAVSLLACFAFAELGAMYPKSGGQYVYLREAYGEFWAFLFGWMVFTVNYTGTIAALAVGFAEYSQAIVPYGAKAAILHVGSWTLTRAHILALAAIAVLTWVNVIGLRRAAVLQNIATWMKFAAIAVFVVLGLAIGKGAWSHLSGWVAADGGSVTAHALGSGWELARDFGVALIAVFFAYDGWSYITCAADEVKEPQRNIPRALVLGVVAVGAIYVALNVVYLYALPMSQVQRVETIGDSAAQALFFPSAGRWISVLIAVSCFGAACACILAGARVVYAMGVDGVFFRSMGRVHPRYRTPAVALVAQGIWSGVLALSGRYDQLYTYVMFIGVLFYVLTVVALFVLRRKQPDVPRPYRCTGYPWLPGVYVVICMVWAGIVLVQRQYESLAGIVIVLLGVPGYLYWRRAKTVTGR